MHSDLKYQMRLCLRNSGDLFIEIKVQSGDLSKGLISYQNN